MSFIKLHLSASGEEIHVNPARIISFQQMMSSTALHLEGGGAMFVTESAVAIERLIAAADS